MPSGKMTMDEYARREEPPRRAFSLVALISDTLSQFHIFQFQFGNFPFLTPVSRFVYINGVGEFHDELLQFKKNVLVGHDSLPLHNLRQLLLDERLGLLPLLRILALLTLFHVEFHVFLMFLIQRLADVDQIKDTDGDGAGVAVFIFHDDRGDHVGLNSLVVDLDQIFDRFFLGHDFTF